MEFAETSRTGAPPPEGVQLALAPRDTRLVRRATRVGGDTSQQDYTVDDLVLECVPHSR